MCRYIVFLIVEENIFIIFHSVDLLFLIMYKKKTMILMWWVVKVYQWMILLTTTYISWLEYQLILIAAILDAPFILQGVFC